MEASEVLNVTSSLKDSYHGNNKGIINAFYQIVQVAHLLIAGQVRFVQCTLQYMYCTCSCVNVYIHGIVA